MFDNLIFVLLALSALSFLFLLIYVVDLTLIIVFNFSCLKWMEKKLFNTFGDEYDEF